jgi:transposase
MTSSRLTSTRRRGRTRLRVAPYPTGRRSTRSAAGLAARPAHPRDKAKVEVAVQIAERWILARLRNETHYRVAVIVVRASPLILP